MYKVYANEFLPPFSSLAYLLFSFPQGLFRPRQLPDLQCHHCSVDVARELQQRVADL